MGLDMYLRADVYVGGWDHGTQEERDRYAAILKLLDLPRLDRSPSVTCQVTVAYWRKANAIHRWFVEKVQDGKDECDPYPVSRAQLTELRDACAEALAIRDKIGEVNAVAVAEERLPTQAGFFFGSTSYDQWYWDDLKDTVEQIDRVLGLKLPDWSSFVYESSW